MMNLYAIWDKKAEEYGPVFTAKNDEVAKRNFNALIKDQPIHPEEYQLCWVGEFDSECFNHPISADISPVNCEVVNE